MIRYHAARRAAEHAVVVEVDELLGVPVQLVLKLLELPDEGNQQADRRIVISAVQRCGKAGQRLLADHLDGLHVSMEIGANVGLTQSRRRGGRRLRARCVADRLGDHRRFRLRPHRVERQGYLRRRQHPEDTRVPSTQLHDDCAQHRAQAESVVALRQRERGVPVVQSGDQLRHGRRAEHGAQTTPRVTDAVVLRGVSPPLREAFGLARQIERENAAHDDRFVGAKERRPVAVGQVFGIMKTHQLCKLDNDVQQFVKRHLVETEIPVLQRGQSPHRLTGSVSNDEVVHRRALLLRCL